MLPPPPKYRARVYAPKDKHSEEERKRNLEKKARIAATLKKQQTIMDDKQKGINICHCGKHHLEHPDGQPCYPIPTATLTAPWIDIQYQYDGSNMWPQSIYFRNH